MDKNKNKIIELYKQGYGTRFIADKYKTYPLKVLRALRKWGVEIRSQSDAQKQSLKVGTREHPTEGKKASSQTKENISRGIKAKWDGRTKKERKELSKKAKKQWDNNTDEYKTELRKKMVKGRLESAKIGSKLERDTAKLLNERDINTQMHTHIYGHECDLFIVERGLAVEIDGPSHYLPIHGKDKLKKVKLADKAKDGEILNGGAAILRVKNVKSYAKIDSINLANYIEEMCEGVIESKVYRVDIKEL